MKRLSLLAMLAMVLVSDSVCGYRYVSVRGDLSSEGSRGTRIKSNSRVDEEQDRALDAKERVKAAEERVKAAEERVKAAEERVKAAEERVKAEALGAAGRR